MEINNTVVSAEDLKGKTVNELAYIIRKSWKPKIYFGAVPYLEAMSGMSSFEDAYGADSGRSIGLYFLSNATTYKGEQARLVKAEIKRRLGIK